MVHNYHCYICKKVVCSILYIIVDHIKTYNTLETTCANYCDKHYIIVSGFIMRLYCEWLNGSCLCSTFHPNLVCQLYGYHVLNVAKTMSYYSVANNCCYGLVMHCL